MFPMDPLTSWLLILGILLGVAAIILTIADLEVDHDEPETEPQRPPVHRHSRTEILYDWRIHGL